MAGWSTSIQLASLFFAVAGTISPGYAQQVVSGISAQEAYVDSEITFQIQVQNAQSHRPPKLPQIDGLKIDSTGSPSRSTNLTINNGRRSSSSTVTYGYIVTPQREGTFTIPAIEVVVNGASATTMPHMFVVTTSETGDLLFVEITSDVERAYVGQAVQLKLKIWVRPYADHDFKYRLSEGEMWQLFSRQTNWGTFADRLEKLRQEDKRPAGHEVLRKDNEGVSRAYLLYEIASAMYPKRPGQIDAGDVRVVVNYPTKIGRSRSRFFDDDFFGPSLLGRFASRRSVSVQASRPIAAEAGLPPIQILDVPNVGRPPGYRGAVGEYRFLVQAETTHAKVGDPITLKLVVQGDGPMELVEAPPLASLQELSRDFKVDNDLLAGFVQDDAKLFTTSIRPRRENVDEIPSLAFSFFDPKRQAFRTVYSQAIPISVEANESLSLDSIVARQKPADRGEKTLQSMASPDSNSGFGLFGVQDMLHEVPPRPAPNRSYSWIAFAIAPTCCFAGLILLNRKRLTLALQFQRDPIATAVRSVCAANTASQIRDGLLKPGLRCTDEIRRVQIACDQSTFSPSASGSLSELRQAALAALKNSTLLVAILFCGATADRSHAGRASPPKLHLNTRQITTILSEAVVAHTAAVELKDKDSDASDERLANAIEKYQLVVDSGFRSAPLQRNLGDAYLHKGDLGRAMAAFVKARRLAPRNREILQRITTLHDRLGTTGTTDAGISPRELLMTVPQSLFRILAVTGWSVVCVLLAAMCVVPSIRHRVNVAIVCFLLLITGAALYVPTMTGTEMDAIAVADAVELRAGDGKSFAVVAVLRSGDAVHVNDRRGKWLFVESAAAARGWILAKQVEDLSAE